MQFEFDAAKRAKNIENHGIDLLYGALIFEGTTVQAPDTRENYGENRMVAIGKVDEQYLVVVYVTRGDAIRLISTRKGGRRDRRKYEATLSGRDQRP